MTKRSLLYLRRNYKRSVLLLLLMVTASLSIAVGLCIWNSINIVTKEVQERLGISFNFRLPTFIVNDDSFYQEVTAQDGKVSKAYIGPKLDDDIIFQIAQIEGIKEYNAENDQWIHIDDIELIGGIFTNGIDPDIGLDNPDDFLGYRMREMLIQSTVVYGNTDTMLFDKFRTGSFTLSEGRHLTPVDRNKVLISEQLADLNDLGIGDEISINMRAGMFYSSGDTRDAIEMRGDSRTLQIVGIFHVNGYQPTEWVSEDEISYNWLITDTEVVKYFQLVQYQTLSTGFIQEPVYKNVTFFVEEPKQLDLTLTKVKEIDSFDIDYYNISVDDTMYKSTVMPLNSIRNLVTGSVMIAVIGCIVVLCIVFTMWVRSRKQEIAIYLSLGFSKASIIGQFILEAAIVAIVATILSFSMCQKIPDIIGNQLLTSTIENAQPQEHEYTREEIHQAAQSGTMSNLFHYEASDYAGPDHIDFTFRFTDFFIVLAIELLIIVGAICKGASFIFKMQPRQIMTELR